MESIFDARKWFWIVAGDENKAWSSAAREYVTNWDSSRVTRIANEVELFDALSRAGVPALAPSRSFSTSEVRQALMNIDAAATGEAEDAVALARVGMEIGMILPPIK